MSKMNVRSILRKIDPEYVRALVETYAPTLAVKIDWEYKDEARNDAIEEQLDRGGEDGGDIRAILIQIGRFFDEGWRAALRSVVVEQPKLLEGFDAAPDTGAAAIAVLVEDPEAFQRAVASAEVDRYIGGRSWSGYAVRGKFLKRAEVDQAARQAFASVAKSIVKSPGPGLLTEFDWHTRTVRDPQTGGEHQIVQATIYAEQPPEGVLRFSGAQLQRQIDRDVSEAAVLWDPQVGTLDVKILGGRKKREELAKAFAGYVLGKSVKIEPIERRRVRLDILTRREKLELFTDDLVESVRVVMMVLHRVSGDGGLLTIKSERDAGRGDVFEAASQWFPGRNLVERPDVRISSVVLRFMRPGAKPGKPRAVTVKLSKPNTSNLHSLTDEDRAVVTALLDRWGLFEPLSETVDERARQMEPTAP